MTWSWSYLGEICPLRLPTTRLLLTSFHKCHSFCFSLSFFFCNGDREGGGVVTCRRSDRQVTSSMASLMSMLKAVGNRPAAYRRRCLFLVVRPTCSSLALGSVVVEDPCTVGLLVGRFFVYSLHYTAVSGVVVWFARASGCSVLRCVHHYSWHPHAETQSSEERG